MKIKDYKVGDIKMHPFSVEFNTTFYRPNTKYSNVDSRIKANLENESNQDMFAYRNQLLLSYKLNDWFSVSTRSNPIW